MRTLMKKTNKNNLSSAELKKILDFSKKLSVDAGKILLRYRKKLHTLKVSEKDNLGVASEADVASEKFIMKAIQTKFPDHEILAEEDSFLQGMNVKEKASYFKKQKYTWMIDPLDGTNNFLAGMDYFCVCISLAYYGNPILGVVYRPTTGEMFFAAEGQGSYKIAGQGKKAKKIHQLNNSAKLKNSLIVTGFAGEKSNDHKKEFKIFKKVMGKSRGIRRMGSAALDMCYVTEGIFDGYWETGLAPWDVAAAAVICKESGVQVCDMQGKKFCPFAASILAARNPLKSKLINIVKG
jgi:myo-inositol-1(or 4)-monophosphatase